MHADKFAGMHAATERDVNLTCKFRLKAGDCDFNRWNCKPRSHEGSGHETGGTTSFGTDPGRVQKL